MTRPASTNVSKTNVENAILWIFVSMSFPNKPIRRNLNTRSKQSSRIEMETARQKVRPRA
jgi:hypothetical protein